MTFNPNLLDEKAVARRLGVTVACLRRWRRVGEGPAWAKLGRLVRYKPQDIDEFVMSNTRGAREVA
jgi:predicted DNA-binding transcriptional regulator AlpA